MDVSNGKIVEAAPSPKMSYKDSLLYSPGDLMNESEEVPEELFDSSPNLEDRWYQDDEWCKPWQAALIVKLLGKKVNRVFMEQRLKKDWAKKGKMEKGSLRSKKGRNWSILDRAPTPRRGNSRLHA
ncbi:hypothetical protein PIB30_076405 [Stylosanthes scabra]|uniref:Uncharacterized protein n=1 Tax=Stylosanthes scabra TaxID=79078 RepID=A0ABU6SQE3_9FABA|nr:hypothetical protein [Stylosanthes scabra]